MSGDPNDDERTFFGSRPDSRRDQNVYTMSVLALEREVRRRAELGEPARAIAGALFYGHVKQCQDFARLRGIELREPLKHTWVANPARGFRREKRCSRCGLCCYSQDQRTVYYWPGRGEVRVLPECKEQGRTKR